MAFACAFDHRAADVDTDTTGRLERREELPCPTADLEHRLSRRDVEAVHVLDEPVVSLVPAAPAIGVLGEPVEEVGELLVGWLDAHGDSGRRTIRATPYAAPGPQSRPS